MENSYKTYKYENYAHYLTTQIGHSKTMYRTARKSFDVYYEKIIKDFEEYDIKKILCVGARDSSEVKFFREKGMDAIGIDLFSIDQSVIRVMDMHTIEENFLENEFDIIYSCHSLEHCVNPEIVLKGMRKISKYGAFIVLPLCEDPHIKDPVVFDFMKKAGDEGDVQVTEAEAQRDFQAVLGENCIIKNFLQLPMLPDKDDGFWFSMFWGK